MLDRLFTRRRSRTKTAPVFASLAFGSPFQGREPEVVTAVHIAFGGSAATSCIGPDAGLVHHHEAPVVPRRQEPGVIGGRGLARDVAVPTDAGIGLEFVNLALDVVAECRPAKPHVLPKLLGAAEDLHRL